MSERLIGRIPAVVTVQVKQGEVVLGQAKKVVLVSDAGETIEELLREALSKVDTEVRRRHVGVTVETMSDE